MFLLGRRERNVWVISKGDCMHVSSHGALAVCNNYMHTMSPLTDFIGFFYQPVRSDVGG